MLQKRFRQISSQILVVMLALLATPAQAAKQVLSGEVCSARVHQLVSEVEWYKSLNKAQAEATRSGKLIVWVHMLGKIDGST